MVYYVGEDWILCSSSGCYRLGFLVIILLSNVLQFVKRDFFINNVRRIELGELY